MRLRSASRRARRAHGSCGRVRCSARLAKSLAQPLLFARNSYSIGLVPSLLSRASLGNSGLLADQYGWPGATVLAARRFRLTPLVSSYCAGHNSIELHILFVQLLDSKNANLACCAGFGPPAHHCSEKPRTARQAWLSASQVVLQNNCALLSYIRKKPANGYLICPSYELYM